MNRPYNVGETSAALEEEDVFATFTENGAQNGRVELDTSDIEYAGEYADTLTFTVS